MYDCVLSSFKHMFESSCIESVGNDFVVSLDLISFKRNRLEGIQVVKCVAAEGMHYILVLGSAVHEACVSTVLPEVDTAVCERVTKSIHRLHRRHRRCRIRSPCRFY